MCFHNAMSKKAKELAKRYGKKLDIIEAWEEIIRERQANGDDVNNFVEQTNHIAAYDEPVCSIITEEEEVQTMQWGLIPSMTKDLSQLERYNKENWFKNARSEDIFQTWPYRFVIESKRCIIPSTHYYEYHHNPDKSTTLYRIYLTNQELYSIGGIWDTWIHPVTKELLHSFTMITTPANPLTWEIHNGGKNPHRMPLILLPEDEQKWIDPNLNTEGIKDLMKVFSDKGMDAYPVSKDFGNRITLPDNKQGTLDF